MMVKCCGYNSVKCGIDLAQNLKLGEYIVFQDPAPLMRYILSLIPQKIPPRVLFVGQIYATILATATQTGGESTPVALSSSKLIENQSSDG